MKFALALAALCGVFALYFAEVCNDDQDAQNHCTHVTCNTTGGWALDCVDDQCTCTHKTPCIGQSDCDLLSHCKDDDKHCIDGFCRCGLHAPHGHGHGHGN